MNKKKGLVWLVVIAFVFLSIPCAFGAQLPLPIDSVSKPGTPSWSLQTSNWIGDRGSWTREAFADFDADGDYDMLVGRKNGLIEHWRNDGNASTPVWVLENGNLLGDVGDYTTPTIIDFDRDGDFDIITGADDGYFRYYKNTGTPTNPSFSLQRTWFDGGSRTAPAMIDYNHDGDFDLAYGRNDQYIYKYKNDVSESGFFMDDFGVGDVGSYTSPAYVDIDNDNDNDLFVGRSDGRVYYYENIGISSSPTWAEATYLFDVGSYADPAFADFDADGDYDMLVGKSDGTLDYYRNDGTASNPIWTIVSGWFTYDVKDRATPYAVDLDNDGDFDIVIGNSDGFVKYYRNIGSTTSASFEFASDNLVGDIGSYAQPALVDLDADGDYDLAIGRSDGYIRFYNNTGSAASYSFSADGNLIGDWHDYSAPTFADIDNDGDLDIASGTDAGWINLFENKGTATLCSFTTEITYWWTGLQKYSSQDFIDFDNDGDLDMIMGREDGYIIYYRNDGTANKPVWTYVRNWLGDQGSRTAPAMADMDNDGDVDMAFGRSDDAYLRYYKNDVTESSFNWTQVSTDMIGDVSDSADPAFADLDADGDLDMVVGLENGYVYYYRNDGTAANPNWTQVSLIVDVGSWASPALGDIDDDGDFDMVVGRSNDAYLRYYRNDGNATHPSWTYVSANWLSSYCRPSSSHSHCTPEFVDLDADGDLDLVVSNYAYGPYYWRNDGSPSIPAWSPIGDLVGDPADYTSATFADIDNDGDYDMVIGERNGKTRYYKNVGSNTSYSWNYIYAGSGGYQWLNRNLGDNTYGKPDFADLDGDGDPDLVYGFKDGYLHYYRDDGLYTTNADRGNHPTWIYKSSNWLGSYCYPGQNWGHGTPDFADLDADGDFDLVVGVYPGHVYYWRNDGSSTNPAWAQGGQIIGNSYDYADPTLGDVDGDGDHDMIVGVKDGYVQYYKNVGSATSHSFTYVHAGSSGVTWIPDVGGYARPELVDIDGDGDLDLCVDSDNGYMIFKENRGLYQTIEDKANNPTWIYDGTLVSGYIYPGQSSRTYGVPALGDIDGDGDLDLAIGSSYGEVHYWRNDGTLGNPLYTFVTNWMDVGSDAGPAFADVDGDGDLDLAVGRDNGYIYYYKNTGTYETATTVTLRDENGDCIANAVVNFADASGLVCSRTTGSNGVATCNITYAGGNGSIEVTNATAGTITITVHSTTSSGSTTITLDTPSPNYKIDLERFQFYTYSADNNADSRYVEIFDNGSRVLIGKSDSNGYLDAYLPKRYLINMREPYTQNRVTYDIRFAKNAEYASSLELNDIYVPNEINLSSPIDAKKLYKFLATHEMSTDANYKGYVLYPALKAQKDFDLQDSVPTNFSYTGDIIVTYLGIYSGSIASPEGDSFSVNYTTSGLEFLSNPVTVKGDWLKVEFTVRTPSLDSFIIHGWTSQGYISPAASLNLTG